MVKFVFFDLDGTVADTLEDLANAVNFALEECALEPYPVDDYRCFVGNGVDNLIDRVLGEHRTDDLHEKVKTLFRDFYAEHALDCTKAYDGMEELLSKLSDNGIVTAVISNKPNRFVPEILEKLYPDHHFALMWGQQENLQRKPAPDALIKAMEELSAENEEVLYVGDSNVDVLFAHSAEVKVCGVEWGFRGRSELLSAGADFIVSDIKSLYDVIMTL